MLMNGFKSFKAHISNLSEMIDFISGFAEANKVAGDKVKEIELASEEAIVNIIKYAYNEVNKEGEVFIKCYSDNESLHIQIADSGNPFNPLEIPEPDISTTIEDRKIGGLGIFFMKQFMNNISYKREQDYNILTMSVTIKAS